MTYPPYQLPYPYRPPPQNGIGIAGFVLGIVGLLISIFPVTSVLALPVDIVGVVLSGIGMDKASRGQANNLGLAIAGLVNSVLGLLLCIVWLIALAAGLLR